MIKIYIQVIICLAIFSCAEQEEDLKISVKLEDPELSLQKVVIALKANKNPEKMLAEKDALEKYLTAKLKREVEVLIPTDSSVVVESFRNGTLDLGYLSSTCCPQPGSGNCVGYSCSFEKWFSKLPKRLA